MGIAKSYIPAYGANADKYWFPMKIAKSRAILVGQVLDKEKIGYFLPTRGNKLFYCLADPKTQEAT